MVLNYNFLRIAPGKLDPWKFPIRPKKKILIYRRIVELLMQLFWKQNRYAFNNSQYSHKDKVPELRNQSKEATPTQQSDLEGSIDPALTSLSWDVSGAVKGQHVFPNSKSPRETSKHARTYSILDDDDIIVQPPASSPTVSTVDTFPRDIFEVPDDPVIIHHHILNTKFQANRRTGSTHNHLPALTETSSSRSQHRRPSTKKEESLAKGEGSSQTHR